MKGQLVIVRSYGNEPLIRRIWEVRNHLVYIINDEEYKKLTSGQRAIEPIGFPKEDVFKYSPEILKILNHNVEWSKLEQWYPE